MLMDMIDFCFQYRVKYDSGACSDKKRELTISISKEDYKKIVQGVLAGTPIEEIEGVADVVAKMKDLVRDVDRWTNRDGSLRSSPMKKSRTISELELFFPQAEYLRLKKMKDPMEVIDRPTEHMTLYRHDGSSVVISCENGRVKINDSRNQCATIIVDVDDFLASITRSL